jgi:hypothetical protein
MTYGIDSRIDTKVAADKSGLLAAMYLLESSTYDRKKDACTVRSADDLDDSRLACSAVVLDDEMPFDCDKQRFRWRVDGWILETTLDGTIVGLSAGSGEQKFEVEEVVLELSGVSFNGCSASSFSPLYLPQVDPNATGRRLQMGGMFSEENTTFPGILSRGMAEHQQARSATFWCGSGTDIETWPCPEDITEQMYADIGRPIGSFEFIESTHAERVQTERACMRHDHGSKSTTGPGGSVRSGCDIDEGLVSETSNSVVQVMFGTYGFAGMWGCWDIGTYFCWKKYYGVWFYVKECEGEHVRYGPFRYTTKQHAYGWIDQSPPNRCTDVLPWATGCTKPGDCD